MTTTTANAENEMFGRIRDVLAVEAPSIDSRWPGIEKPDPPNQNSEWCAISIKHADGYQGSLSGADGARRWRREGQLHVQVFAPGTFGRQRARDIACALRDAFQSKGTSSGVWFRRVNATDIGKEKNWYNWNMSLRFIYDEVK